jgi:iron complex outermembrane receptor protein
MFKMKNVLLILALGLLITLQGIGQSNVKGKVLDAITKKPLAGASVSINNKKISTDNYGNFTYLCNAKESIKVSFVGYETKMEENKNCSSDLIIFLNPTVLTLDEVEVANSTNSNKTLLYQPAAISNLNQTNC